LIHLFRRVENRFRATKNLLFAEKGVVYLMGLVSKSESDIAARVTSETKGVQKVVRVFEYY